VPGAASDLSRQLARNAEAVCRHYLPAGRPEGRYWIVGDALGSPGRSLYVRLRGGEHGKGAAGKWTDAATGEHGDLLDLIALNCGHHQLSEALDEARRFLALPMLEPSFDPNEPGPARQRGGCSRHHGRSPARLPSAICGHAQSPASAPIHAFASTPAAGIGLRETISPGHRLPFPP
jgi:hypothetical protein